MRKSLFAFFAVAALLLGISACSVTDNPASGDVADNPNLPKQGIWTEFDTLLVSSGKNTIEELEAMPGVGMMIKGDKAYFFTYTEDGADNLVEGAISYDKEKGTGTIAFPTIKDSPVSGQTVNFTMTSSETMEFELEYEGVKETATCSWLCKDLDGWNADADESDWEELLTYYQKYPEDAGPDGSIDWSADEVVEMDGEKVTVTGLDEPLEWNDDVAAARGGTRMVGAIMEGISAGLDIFSSLFEPDPMEEINAKLDQVLGKLDQALANQQKMMLQLDKIDKRLIAIAEKLKKQEIVNAFNDRNKTYFIPLDGQNTKYFADAYALYTKNKGNLSQADKDKLGEYAKAWVGDGEKYADLTWNYIKYLSDVKHTDYGQGMAAIYDGMTFEKYPWEHMGIGDRNNYRAYDMFVIAKGLFMINLYAAYGGLSDIKKGGLYNIYNSYKTQMKDFCLYKISNPKKFLVSQIKGAHFIMHKELQKYNYCGPDNKCPHPRLYGGYDALYRPEWHQAGSVKIDNPKELKSKLISVNEAYAIYDYYKAIYKQENIHWADMLVEHKIDNNNVAGGADYALAPKPDNEALTFLMLHDTESWANGVNFVDGGKSLGICPVVSNYWRLGTSVIPAIRGTWHYMGTIYVETVLLPEREGKWIQYNEKLEYYGAIVEKRYTPTK